MVYPFTQTAEPALAVGFIATNYRYHRHTSAHKQRVNYPIIAPAARARLAKCTSLDPRSRLGVALPDCLLFGDASDGSYPCLSKWMRLILGFLKKGLF
jgi:hypothetical protein